MSNRTRTLDEALDEVDRWSAKVVSDLESLAPDEQLKYFAEAARRFEERMKAPLPRRRKRQPAKK